MLVNNVEVRVLAVCVTQYIAGYRFEYFPDAKDVEVVAGAHVRLEIMPEIMVCLHKYIYIYISRYMCVYVYYIYIYL
jgi:hypothetical protein